ncbi:MAG: hypothetical protein R2848_18165 [Thermomicrobiales bacterium]
MPISRAIPKATHFYGSIEHLRLGELFIRWLSEVTTELTVHLLPDASGSMDWSGDAQRITKFTGVRGE